VFLGVSPVGVLSRLPAYKRSRRNFVTEWRLFLNCSSESLITSAPYHHGRPVSLNGIASNSNSYNNTDTGRSFVLALLFIFDTLVQGGR